MPGVLQLEAMAQVGSILLFRHPGNAGKIGYFMSADSVKFRKPVAPGDTLFIEVEMTQRKKLIAKCRGRCIVNNEVVSEAEMMFGIVDS
jgi:UDP-3-O-[3-hydroxymyristoyl] N-acetylglucosamine deacetylase/3-hydroxyacyl-[acyl-carrier-protein] dehydratase